MFPRTFKGQVAQRMAIWGAALGFLFLLLVTIEIIQASRMGEITREIQQTNQVLKSSLVDTPDIGRVRLSVEKIAALSNVETELLSNDYKNKILIGLLTVFALGQILFLEFRWLVKPVIGMAKALRKTDTSGAEFAADALRRDEIGDLARSLENYIALTLRQKQNADDETAKLSTRLARQEEFKRESMAFQQRIAGIVTGLENHAKQMARASEELESISSEADRNAETSAQSTQRVAGHVGIVSASIGEIANTMTAVAGEARKTSEVAILARGLVLAASDDAKVLREAARTIEQVIALINEVADQTNLLALNATIEAARAGEMGRGFAIVAAEVKQLATKTSLATRDIGAGLEGINATSARIADRVAELVNSIEQVDGVSAAIARSMHEQETNSQAITTNTTKTAQDVREVAKSVEQLAGMIGEAKKASDTVTKISSELNNQATDLRGAVERFMATSERIAA